MFTLHDMLIPMPLPCICDPCFALHMMIDSSTCVFASLVEILLVIAMFALCPMPIMIL